MAPCRVRSGHSRAEDDLVPVQRWNRCAERGVGLWHWELWKIDRLLHCRLHLRQWTCDQQPQVRVTSVSVVPWWDLTFFLLDLYASKHESVDLQGSRYLLWCGLLLTGSALGALHCRRTEASGEHCCMQELSKAITCLINVYVCYFTISIMDGCCPAERGRYSLRKGLFFSTLRLAWHVRAYTASESFPTSIRVRTWRWQILNPTVVAVARQMP